MKKGLVSFVSLLLFLATGVAMAQVPADTLRKYRQVIRETADENAHEAYLEILDKYIIDRSDIKTLQRLLYKREKLKARCRYQYPNSIRDRVRAKRAIDEVYRDSINAILIIFNKGISGENISAALRALKVIDLEPVRRKMILDEALSVARRRRENPNVDTWDEELEVITSCFGKDKMKGYFSIRNAEETTEKMQAAWQTVVDAGQTEDLDSAWECTRAYFYIFEELRLKCLYKNKKDILAKSLKNLHSEMPPLLRRQEALLKKDESEARKDDDGKPDENKGIIW